MGTRAERLAEAFLKAEGLEILGRNFRCKAGEIDLIAEDRGTVVFVEVRLRRNGCFGGAGASITPSKQGRIRRAASLWLNQTRDTRPCRFDALLFDELEIQHCDWVRNAFMASDE